MNDKPKPKTKFDYVIIIAMVLMFIGVSVFFVCLVSILNLSIFATIILVFVYFVIVACIGYAFGTLSKKIDKQVSKKG